MKPKTDEVYKLKRLDPNSYPICVYAGKRNGFYGLIDLGYTTNFLTKVEKCEILDYVCNLPPELSILRVHQGNNRNIINFLEKANGVELSKWKST